MIILGLTGSVGMGKSTAAAMFRRLGIPVHDSDAAVHRLMARGGLAVGPIGAAFPGCVKNDAVDRAVLRGQVFGNAPALSKLEAILHPLVRLETMRFLKRAARSRASLVVLDVPLLLETGGERRCDAVAVVSAPFAVQRARVLARPGITEETFQSILKHQMSDNTKRRYADFVLYSGLGKAKTLRDIMRLVRLLKRERGRKWPPFHTMRERPRARNRS